MPVSPLQMAIVAVATVTLVVDPGREELGGFLPGLAEVRGPKW